MGVLNSSQHCQLISLYDFGTRQYGRALPCLTGLHLMAAPAGRCRWLLPSSRLHYPFSRFPRRHHSHTASPLPSFAPPAQHLPSATADICAPSPLLPGFVYTTTVPCPSPSPTPPCYHVHTPNCTTPGGQGLRAARACLRRASYADHSNRLARHFLHLPPFHPHSCLSRTHFAPPRPFTETTHTHFTCLGTQKHLPYT